MRPQAFVASPTAGSLGQTACYAKPNASGRQPHAILADQNRRKETVVVDLTDLECTYELVSSDCNADVIAFVDLDTGRIYCVCDGSPDELPDDFEESDRYVPVPSRHDFDLGRPLVLDFVATELPGDYDLVNDYFHRRGAYRNYRQLLESRDATEKWYAFEQAATEKALREWCQENNLELRDLSEPATE